MDNAAVISLVQRTQLVSYLHCSFPHFRYVITARELTSIVAGAIIVLWEQIVTAQCEYDLIWKASFGIGKALFIMARYLIWPQIILILWADASRLSETQCRHVFSFTVWWTFLVTINACAILIMRTWALWDAQRRVIVGLCGTLAATIVPVTYLLTLYAGSSILTPMSLFSPTLTGCALETSGHINWIGYVLLSSFDLLILSMTVVKGFRDVRIGASSILSVLYRDGIIYFTCSFLLSVTNLTLIIAGPAAIGDEIRMLQGFFFSILSCRVILHLRQASAAIGEDDLTTSIEWARGRRIVINSLDFNS
ncbi:hypothetical protein EXIGLDRAFT_722674 [Exidia glandulosa HHB12029]|uniref:DUF6533 domain-containing protein n=1 Tax=Exidia glandulosa HHB12029 TaxID=1314781 RepID=A0A165F5W8_EXIGL|nr:hypothetical protein EXIGLDRAFT_722674 [Exidia glandulosa HHB12029]